LHANYAFTPTALANPGAHSSSAGWSRGRQRLYQLGGQEQDVRLSTFEIEFVDSGVEASSFTFGCLAGSP